MVYLTTKLGLILDELDSVLAEGCVLFNLQGFDVARAKELLETHEWRSCVISKKKAKKISELLGRDIPLYDGSEFTLQEGDMIMVYIDYPFAVDESAIDQTILSVLPRFDVIEIVNLKNAPSVLTTADNMI